jgi:hypothetical protein
LRGSGRPTGSANRGPPAGAPSCRWPSSPGRPSSSSSNATGAQQTMPKINQGTLRSLGDLRFCVLFAGGAESGPADGLCSSSALTSALSGSSAVTCSSACVVPTAAASPARSAVSRGCTCSSDGFRAVRRVTRGRCGAFGRATVLDARPFEGRRPRRPLVGLSRPLSSSLMLLSLHLPKQKPAFCCAHPRVTRNFFLGPFDC